MGDHAPAYLINLYLATGADRYARMLEYTFDTIEKHFPDYDASPFVQEKFHEDWSPDRTHMWQQNRAVVGHNLKIAWNLLRMYGLRPKPAYERLARKIGELMPAVGSDRQRGGWYDVMERQKAPGEDVHRFAFHDRKAWWQQEQAILAYLILAGVCGDEEYRRHAREAASFYNAFFLDHDDGAVYFNVLASGVPFLMGTERLQGQPLDERLPFVRAVLSRAGVRQPADRRTPAGPPLQADARGVRGQPLAGGARHPSARSCPPGRGLDRRRAVRRLRPRGPGRAAAGVEGVVAREGACRAFAHRGDELK